MAHPKAYLRWYNKRAVIVDVQAIRVKGELLNHLVIDFEEKMRHISLSTMFEVKYHLGESRSAKEHGCEGFDLVMTRIFEESSEHWLGVYTRGNQRLEVQGHVTW